MENYWGFIGVCRGIQGLGFRVWDLGFRVWGLGFRDKGLRFPKIRGTVSRSP